MQVVTFVYPAWHDRFLRPEIKTAEKFNEWSLVKSGKKYFRGHVQPRRPHTYLGYYDDTLVETAEKQIEIASSYGVDVFTYMFYWNQGRRELAEPLDVAFLNSKNIDNVKFSLMWCWKTPRRNFPVTPGANHLYEEERIIVTDEEDFSKMIQYCCDKYFGRNNYWKIDGKPVFFMYTLQGYLKLLGKEYLKRVIEKGKEVAVKNGYPGIHLIGITWNDLDVDIASSLGFDMLTTYVFLPDFDGSPIQKYQDLIQKRMVDWKSVELKTSVDFYPSVSPGWDGSSRGIFYPESLKLSKSIFPWTPIVTNFNPRVFGDFAREAVKFSNNKYLFVASWNEWSEGHAIEPDSVNGYGLLDQIQYIKNKV